MSSRIQHKKSEHTRLVVLRAAAHKAQDGLCIYCFEPIRLKEATADHIHPQVKFGLTRPDNIVAACQPCNRLKGSMSATKFRAMLKTLPPNPSIPHLLAHFRRRLWLRTFRATNRIRAAVGMEIKELPSIKKVVDTLTAMFGG